ncbi:XRE family transcriptional regulator [Streptococcus parauberis]|uniref:helix-turn-helix domain-containing protein n=1 Tax=Streptococcus parauberis TaxID=1348 RepID=UPI00280B9D1C|nr:helix-turn-helix domain-containing protein [Streptococcus parauberis]WEM65247.1 XRE family transcriptional regulator [Streptococcus parauberis]
MSKNAFEKLIDDTGIKRKVIAERLDISRSSLYKKAKNPRKMGTDEMAEFADVLGIDTEAVFNAILKLSLLTNRKHRKR